MTRHIHTVAIAALLALALPALAQTTGPHIDRMQKQIDEAKVKLTKAQTDLATAKANYEKSDAAMKAATDRCTEARATITVAQKAESKQAAEAHQAERKPEADPKLTAAQTQVTLDQASVDAIRGRVLGGLSANPDYAAARANAETARTEIKVLRGAIAPPTDKIAAAADRLADAEKAAADMEDKALAADPDYAAAKVKLDASLKALADLKRAAAGPAAKEALSPIVEAKQKLMEAERARSLASADRAKTMAVYASANNVVVRLEADIKKLEMQLKAMKDDSRRYKPGSDDLPPRTPKS